jgi:hypothetical protein
MPWFSMVLSDRVRARRVPRGHRVRHVQAEVVAVGLLSQVAWERFEFSTDTRFEV